MLTSIAKCNDVIGTDDDLKAFRKAGGKMITYHGLSDRLIFPRGTYHYYSVLQGNYKETQKFYRFFPYPGNGHCGGGAAPLITRTHRSSPCQEYYRRCQSCPSQPRPWS